jgi:hypothetical protein
MTVNSVFTVGQTLKASEMNRLGFGVCAYASAASNYNITTTLTAVPDITVSWTADSTRRYKITYYEPQVASGTLANSYIGLALYLGSTAGTELNTTLYTIGSATQITNGVTVMYVGGFASGAKTVIGAAIASSTTGTPRLVHAGSQEPYILVEDIGPL